MFNKEEGMNIALWVVQGLLAAAFLMAGQMKVFSYEKYRAMAGPHTPSRGLVRFIGLSEIAGALGLILPLATGVLPFLTPVAAAALAVVMVLALGFHAKHKDPMGKMVPPLVLLALSVFVAWGRMGV
jgi:uncharacterized membrane protein YphA (DoxX/SURF4 family)